MLSSLWDILIKPDAFFQEILNKKVYLLIPALIVLGWGIVGVFSAYYYIFGLDINLITFFPSSIITYWILWFFVTILFYCLSLFFFMGLVHLTAAWKSLGMGSYHKL
jgi:hypothetical protein